MATTPLLLALGTVQLGQAYGVANRDGLPDEAAVDAILTQAVAGGIAWLDTAQDYGLSEARIGRFLATAAAGTDIRVVTKLSFGTDMTDEAAVQRAAEDSIRVLGRVPDAVMVHNPDGISQWHQGIGAALGSLLKAGLTRAVGASVYTPEQFAAVIRDPAVSVVQAPLNLFDRRLEACGLLAEAERAGVTVFARSIFLQGLLTLHPEELPPRLAFAAPALSAFHEVVSVLEATPIEAAFRFVVQRYPGVVPVVGCETPAQLAENLALMQGPVLDQGAMSKLAALSRDNERLVNPALWPKA